ncbi:hypothetical protein [Victivallis sp.]|uniref:hypothetical protein n=1 Tax=Victivallis sp. TaxID=2049020 RepID=UPI003A8EF76B
MGVEIEELQRQPVRREKQIDEPALRRLLIAVESPFGNHQDISPAHPLQPERRAVPHLAAGEKGHLDKPVPVQSGVPLLLDETPQRKLFAAEPGDVVDRRIQRNPHGPLPSLLFFSATKKRPGTDTTPSPDEFDVIISRLKKLISSPSTACRHRHA